MSTQERIPETTTTFHDTQALAEDAGRYWARSGERPWIRDMSHWRGQGRWADDAVWRGVGQRHLAMFTDLYRVAGRAPRTGTMLEWVPGGGSNAIAFAPSVDTLVGVDISQPNLNECGRQLAAEKFSHWHPILIDAAHPEEVLIRIPAPIDFFLSTAVFQHFPGKDYGRRILKIAADLMSPDGLALIQIRYDDGSEILRPKNSDYEKNVVTFTSYRIEEFWQNCADTGWSPLSVTLNPTDCYATYWLRKG